MANQAVLDDARDQALAVIANPAPNAPAAPAQNPLAPENLPSDPDDRALYLARQEEATIDAGAKSDGNPQVPAAQPAQQAQRPRMPMIPKARVDEMQINARQQIEQRDREIIALQQQLLQRPTLPNPGQRQQAPTQPTLTLDQQILAYQATVSAAAKQFDAGELSMEQFVTVQNTTTNAIQSLRERALFDAVQRNRPAQLPGLADQAILNRETGALEHAHPYLAVMDANDLNFLGTQFRTEQAALGRPVGTGPTETLRLRKGIAELSSFYGPRLYPQFVQQQASTPAPGTQQAAQPYQAPSGSQAAAKLATAAAHPPHINQPSTANVGEDVSEARLENMSTEEIAALPPAMRERLLNR